MKSLNHTNLVRFLEALLVYTVHIKLKQFTGREWEGVRFHGKGGVPKLPSPGLTSFDQKFKTR